MTEDNNADDSGIEVNNVLAVNIAADSGADFGELFEAAREASSVLNSLLRYADTVVVVSDHGGVEGALVGAKREDDDFYLQTLTFDAPERWAVAPLGISADDEFGDREWLANEHYTLHSIAEDGDDEFTPADNIVTIGRDYYIHRALAGDVAESVSGEERVVEHISIPVEADEFEPEE